jgi:hypothetical protein
VAVLQRSRKEADILRACESLGEASESRQGRDEIVAYRDGEAMEAVTAAMQDFGGEPDILASACNFISHMSMGMRARAALAQLGAVELIVAAIKAHSENSNLLEHACGAFINLAIDRSISTHIGAVGGIRAAMQTVTFATGVSDISPHEQEQVLGEQRAREGVQHAVMGIALASTS